MPTRFVVYADAMNKIDSGPILDYLADDVAADMMKLSPVDEGDMRSTIRVRSYGSKRSRRVVVGGMRGKVTGKPVDYAGYVERGTSKMPAQPFMKPALYRYRSA
jgi:HK97 gp10 family phage protein